jgi:hypothetical protein
MFDMTMFTHSLLLFFVLLGSVLWVTEMPQTSLGEHNVFISEAFSNSKLNPWS